MKTFDIASGLNGPINALHWSPDGRSLQYPLDKKRPA
jgi:hypothetical protein